MARPERLRKTCPILAAADDVFTNHLHADDLALACLLALFRARPLRAMNVCDDRQLRMGDYLSRRPICTACRAHRASRAARRRAALAPELELYERIAPPLQSPFKDRTQNAFALARCVARLGGRPSAGRRSRPRPHIAPCRRSAETHCTASALRARAAGACHAVAAGGGGG